MEELNLNFKKLGELEATANREDKELNSLEYQRQEAIRNLQKAFDNFRGGEALERRLELVRKTQIILEKYLTRLTVTKVHSLEELITARFKELIRKPDLIKSVEIEPENFNITIYGDDSQPLSKNQLSAGEKQMLAISILWALRQLSGRPFPIAIDTPLGRLDSDHRSNLVNHYFPNVSHQVILFSTDKEIDKTYFEALKPFISHAYHLIYDPKKGATRVEEGYFWNEATDEVEQNTNQ
jgi:DNA sulfur modification protein DndD